MKPAHLAAAAAALLMLGGCAGSPAANRIAGTRLVIYMSSPLHGSSKAMARAEVNAARMALASQGGRIGKYVISLKVLDDSAPQGNGWDPSQTSLNARLAAQDPATIGYLGELDSGASAVSIPVLNRAGIAQVSPGSPAVGLTSSRPGASPGEPEKYYPTGIRTFARVVPSTAVESEAQVGLEQSMGCHSAFVLQDGGVDGSSGAITFVLTAQARGLEVLGIQAFAPQTPDYSSLAASVAQTNADCVLISAIDGPSAARLARDVALNLPNARIFGSSALAQPAFTDPARGGLAPALDSRVFIVSPALGPSSYPPAARPLLVGAFPQAVFGYAAMSLLLDAIRRASDNGRKPVRRSAVIASMLSPSPHQSILGRFTINADGDTSLMGYGIYKVVGGRLSFWRGASR